MLVLLLVMVNLVEQLCLEVNLGGCASSNAEIGAWRFGFIWCLLLLKHFLKFPAARLANRKNLLRPEVGGDYYV